jgi:hypothetical protein
MAPGGVSLSPMLPGIPAALFMAVTKTLFKAASLRDHLKDRAMAGLDGASRRRTIFTGLEKITRGLARDVRLVCGERELGNAIAVMAIRWRASKESIF